MDASVFIFILLAFLILRLPARWLGGRLGSAWRSVLFFSGFVCALALLRLWAQEEAAAGVLAVLQGLLPAPRLFGTMLESGIASGLFPGLLSVLGPFLMPLMALGFMELGMEWLQPGNLQPGLPAGPVLQTRSGRQFWLHVLVFTLIPGMIVLVLLAAGTEPLSALRAALLLSLLLAASGSKLDRPAVLLLLILLGLLSLFTLPRPAGINPALLASGLGCLGLTTLLTRLPERSALASREAILPDLYMLLALGGLSFATATKLPLPLMAFLAGISLAGKNKRLLLLRKRYRLLFELGNDALLFFFGFISALQGFGLAEFSLTTVVILLLAGLTAFAASRSSRRAHQSWLGYAAAALPVQMSAWVIAAYMVQSSTGISALGPAIAVLALLHGILERLLQKPGSDAGQAQKHQRVLTGVADTDLAATLISFSACFSLHQRGSQRDAGSANDTVLHAVCVEERSSSSVHSARSAEDLLVRSVAAAAQEGLRLIPSFTVSDSPAQGLLRSAAETRADVIVIGWSRQVDGQGTQVIREKLLEHAGQQLVQVRNPAAFKAARRMFVFIPGSLQELAFSQHITDSIAGLALWAGRPQLHLLTLRDDRFSADAAARAGLHFDSVLELEGWREMEAELREHQDEHSSIVVLSHRPYDRDRDPRLQQLPLALAKHRPDSGLVVIYPAAGAQAAKNTADNAPDSEQNASEDPQNGLAAAQNLPELIVMAQKHSRILPAMPEAALVDAIHSLMQTMFPGNRVIARKLAGDFFDSARVAPIELEPGILLLHAHVETISEPTVAIGSSHSGWKLAALQQPVMVVVILCSPSGASPQIHLAALGQLAGALGDRSFMNTLFNNQN